MDLDVMIDWQHVSARVWCHNGDDLIGSDQGADQGESEPACLVSIVCLLSLCFLCIMYLNGRARLVGRGVAIIRRSRPRVLSGIIISRRGS